MDCLIQLIRKENPQTVFHFMLKNGHNLYVNNLRLLSSSILEGTDQHQCKHFISIQNVMGFSIAIDFPFLDFNLMSNNNKTGSAVQSKKTSDQSSFRPAMKYAASNMPFNKPNIEEVNGLQNHKASWVLPPPSNQSDNCDQSDKNLHIDHTTPDQEKDVHVPIIKPDRKPQPPKLHAQATSINGNSQVKDSGTFSTNQ